MVSLHLFSPLIGAAPATPTTTAPSTPDGMSPQSVQQATYNGKATWASSSELKNVKVSPGIVAMWKHKEDQGSKGKTYPIHIFRTDGSP